MASNGFCQTKPFYQILFGTSFDTMCTMKSNYSLYRIMSVPGTSKELKRKQNKLFSENGDSFQIKAQTPIVSTLDEYTEIEAKAWEDEWKKGISKSAMKAYKKNMKIFKSLGFWEESGDAASLIPSKKNFTVLDLGCGNGLSTSKIKGRTVIGLDLSAKQMIRAKRKYPEKFFVSGDARKLPFKSHTFDMIVCINLLHHIGSPDKVLKECHRVLKKGGTLLTVDPNLYNPIGFVGRGLFKLLNLKKIFPSFPQFALGEDERQFTKKQYYNLFEKSPFKNYKIQPHRIERILFFSTILVPSLINFPFYEPLLVFVSRAGNNLVKVKPFDQLCYFWLGEATK